LPTLYIWSEVNFHQLPNISRTYPYGYQNFQKEKPRLFEPEKQETPSVPLFRGKRPPLGLPEGRRRRNEE
jgi:hypothetical protein